MICSLQKKSSNTSYKISSTESGFPEAATNEIRSGGLFDGFLFLMLFRFAEIDVACLVAPNWG